MEQKNLSVEEVALALKVSKQTVWRMCKKGKLPAFRLPNSRRWLINKKEFDKQQNELMEKNYENR